MPSRPTDKAATAQPHAAEIAPDRRAVTKPEAEYLFRISGVPAEKLVGRPIAELTESLRWKIDPFLLLFRRICGRVVRRDPVTGVLQGVPNATVHVEDTDCTFLGFFPVENPSWWWLWLVHCHREDLGITTTDACGRFCVFIPRWDIDRILRFRLERVCFPEIAKPSLGDLLRDLDRRLPRPPFPPNPNPPDPPPFELPAPEVLRQVAAHAGPGVADRLTQLATQPLFGESTGDVEELLAGPAFAEALPPPLTAPAVHRLSQLQVEHPRGNAKASLELPSIVREKRRYGPFLRCRDILVPEWQVVFDVPDITFRVTQDVDLDGDQEEIYTEGLFDVRWNAGAMGTVVLEASALARPSAICIGPSLACTDVPAIRSVGVMPLEASHHDLATGYATRVNRPRPGGLSTDPQVSPAQAPYAGTLQLHGCQHIGAAKFYRLLYAYPPAAFVPFTGLQWWAPRLGFGPPIPFTPDGDGWYAIVDEALLVFPHWLLNWPSNWYPNGRYDVKLQLGDVGKAVIAESAVVPFTIDHRLPNAGFSQIRWRPALGAWLAENVFTWPFACPVIRRPTGVDIQVEVTWWASAVHFRDAVMGAGGCGTGDPILLSSQASHDHWHENAGDNTVARVALFSIPNVLAEGSYTFGIDAHTRAFNPAGDGGGPGVDWFTNYAYSHAHPSVAVSVINA